MYTADTKRMHARTQVHLREVVRKTIYRESILPQLSSSKNKQKASVSLSFTILHVLSQARLSTYLGLSFLHSSAPSGRRREEASVSLLRRHQEGTRDGQANKSVNRKRERRDSDRQAGRKSFFISERFFIRSTCFLTLTANSGLISFQKFKLEIEEEKDSRTKEILLQTSAFFSPGCLSIFFFFCHRWPIPKQKTHDAHLNRSSLRAERKPVQRKMDMALFLRGIWVLVPFVFSLSERQLLGCTFNCGGVDTAQVVPMTPQF